jgi:hypothetical protein
MNYEQKVLLARAVAVTIVAVTLIQAGNAEMLGITPRIGAWLAILVGVLGAVAGFLPNVRGTDQQPEHIANRMDDLSAADRQRVMADQIQAMTPTERAALRIELERRNNAPPPPPGDVPDHIIGLLDRAEQPSGGKG